MYQTLIKPFFDFTFSLFSLLLLSPLLIIISFLLVVEHRGKAFFIQERAKKNGVPFYMIKFRTLKENGQPSMLGNVLRASSLDELPQLINVIKGEMSLIGPRPLYIRYNHLYSPEQKKRLCVKPGITGLAQINGRNLLSWDQKFELDLRYINRVSMRTDSCIFFTTIYQLLLNFSVKSKYHQIVEEFKG